MRNVNKKSLTVTLEMIQRPYTEKEKKMVADWLKNNKVKTNTNDKEKK